MRMLRLWMVIAATSFALIGMMFLLAVRLNGPMGKQGERRGCQFRCCLPGFMVGAIPAPGSIADSFRMRSARKGS